MKNKKLDRKKRRNFVRKHGISSLVAMPLSSRDIAVMRKNQDGKYELKELKKQIKKLKKENRKLENDLHRIDKKERDMNKKVEKIMKNFEDLDFGEI